MCNGYDDYLHQQHTRHEDQIEDADSCQYCDEPEDDCSCAHYCDSDYCDDKNCMS